MHIKCRFAYFCPNHSSEIVTNMLEKEKEREITCWLCKQSLVMVYTFLPVHHHLATYSFDDAGCCSRGVATKLNTQPTLCGSYDTWFFLVQETFLEVKYSHAGGKIFHFL